MENVKLFSKFHEDTVNVTVIDSAHDTVVLVKLLSIQLRLSC